MANRKVLIMEPFCESDMEKIRSVFTKEYDVVQIKTNDEEALMREIKDAEIVVGQPPMALLQNPEENCPKLKYLQMTWAGTDMYTAADVPFPKERIMLANGSGTYGMIMSQFVIGMTLSVLLHFGTYHTQQLDKIWQRRGPVRSLEGSKVLIFGAGDIGTAIAKRLTGFDCYCIGVCRNTEKKREYFHELCTLDEAERYLPEADVVIGCIPNTPDTAGYMTRKKIQSMKKDAVLVNVGRGNFIDCMALDELLRAGHLWGAALDVTYPEPLPQDHPLWNNPKCMITPHASGGSFGQLRETEELLCKVVCDNMERYCSGKEIKNRIF